MTTMTEKAIAKIKEISESEGIGHCNVRAKIQGGGCAGFQYDLNFEEKIQDTDEVMEFDGIQLIIDPISFQYMENVTIDYLEAMIGAGFKFINPDVKSTCGCGHSVEF